MIVTNRRLSILAIAAAALIVVTVLLYWTGRRTVQTFEKDTPLIQGLDVGKIARITLKASKGTVTIERRNDEMVVVERSGYPASMSKVNDLILKCLDIKCASRVTDNRENFDDLGVGEKPETASVRFEDADNSTLLELLVGKTPEKAGGPYVRLASNNTVYAAEGYVWFDDNPNGFIDTQILNVAKDDTVEVSVQNKDNQYTLTKGEDGNATLDRLPEGKRAKQAELNAVFTALSYLSFEDVRPAASFNPDWDTTSACRLKGKITYIAETAKKDDRTFLRLSAKGPSAADIRRASMIRETDPKEELEKKDAILTANDKALKFNEQHKPWVYIIPEWKASNLRKTIDEIVEDVPSADAPEEVAASHILIAYAGAERSTVTRTKDEAKARAEEVLAKAKAEDADFAALAKEYSDGPTRDKGGDLGTFKKGAMAKAFEDAAWKLKVDEISDVVETPFGFHIIKRTK